MYKKPLPRIDNIYLLKNLIASFPVTVNNVIRIARRWRFSRSTIEFLKYFPEGEEFSSPEEFIARRRDIEIFINESKHDLILLKNGV